MFEKTPSPMTFTALLALIVLTCAAPVAAETSWQLRAFGVWADTAGRTVQVLPGGPRVESDGNTDFGFGLTAEWRFSERMGLEFGALMVTTPELEVGVGVGPARFTVRDSLGMRLVGAGVNFHLTPDKAVDVYLGPFVGWAAFSDLGFVVPDEAFPVRFRIGGELALGAVLGLDVPIDDHWSFNASARYVEVGVEPDGPDGRADDLDLDTLALGLGVGFRF